MELKKEESFNLTEEKTKKRFSLKPGEKTAAYAFYIIGALLLIVVPLFVESYTLNLLVLSVIFAILALSWNMIAGYAGIFSFGHQAFFGIGGYVSALLAMKLGISPWLGIIFAGVLSSVLGALICLPVLRLRAAPYIAILTLGFAEIVQLVASNLVGLTRGELGLNGIPPLPDIGPISFNMAHTINFYYLALLFLFIFIFVVYKVVKGPEGLALSSIKESQDAAKSLGVNLTKYKLYVFMLSAFIAGVAGSLYAHYVMILTPSSVMAVDIMMKMLVMTMIGGLGTIVGPIIGSFIVEMGLEYLRFLGDYRLVIYGAVLILVIMFMPGGIAKSVSHFVKKLLKN